MPNPANGNTTIQYSLKNAGAVTLTITDITGKVVYTSNEGNKAAGDHSVNVNTENMNAGVYFYTLNVDGVSVTNKMTVTH
jgi:flagellar hook assembly protein FlgD